jgi:FkbM family methyltransferase
MSYIRRYLIAHFNMFRFIYNSFMLKKDKKFFALLFNLKSFLNKKSLRVKWNENHFVTLDKNFPDIKYTFRNVVQGNMTYKYGLQSRADGLARAYFLDQIDFNDKDIFLDCGANVGDLLLYFKLKNIDINYIGFEPSPSEFKCLKRNVHPSKAYNIGLWDKFDELDFYVSSDGADSSLIKPISYDSKIVVKTKRLDTIINEKIKCLKLEAEGSEPEIIDGIGNKLKYIQYITADLGPERGERSEYTLASVTNKLLSNGFKIVDAISDRIAVLYQNEKYIYRK